MGDSLYLMGRPGLSKWVLDNLKNDQLATMSELTINYHLEAMSCLELGSKILSLNGITAAMDLSDGLSLTCHEMSSQSQVKFVLDQQKFRFPKPLDSLELNQKMEYFLTSGEEYFSLVSIAQHIEIPIALSKDPDFFQVGEVQQGIGVEIITQKGKICTLKEIGFSHFD